MELLLHSAIAFSINGFYAIMVMLLTITVFCLLDRYVFRQINFRVELLKNNLSVAIVVAAAFLAVAMISSSAFGAANTTTHDRHFKKYSRRFFAHGVDWQWFKCQAIAESSLNKKAISPVGARGLMQLMPATSAEMARRLGVPDRPMSPRYAIMMGIAYDRRMYSIWKAEKGVERLRYMFASYNAGAGNIIKAQRIAPCPERWKCIAHVLPRITGRHAQETITYVTRIENLKRRAI